MIQYRVKGSAKWSKANGTNAKRVLKSLTNGKKYQVRVKAYAAIGGKRANGAWSPVSCCSMKNGVHDHGLRLLSGLEDQMHIGMTGQRISAFFNIIPGFLVSTGNSYRRIQYEFYKFICFSFIPIGKIV